MKNPWINRALAAEKKLLYVALAAMMLISCDPNAPKVPSKDNKAVDNLSKNLLSLLGEKKKDVKSTLESYGFEDISRLELGSLPARLGLTAKEAESYDMAFFYGNLDAYKDAMEEEDMDVFIDDMVDHNTIAIMVMLDLDDSNKLEYGQIVTYAPAETKNIKNLYAKFSKNLFLSLGDGKKWSAQLADADDMDEEPKEYTSAKKRDKFEEDFAEIEFSVVQESGSDELDDETVRSYGSQWISDMSLMSKEIDGLAGCMCSFGLEKALTPEP